jgi:hypothetical protein
VCRDRGVPRPGRLCRLRRDGRQAANPGGNQIPAVHFGTAVLAARKVFAGTVIYRLAGDLGDQVL